MASRPIDPTRYVADGSNTPATLLGSAIPYSESPLNTTGIGATEDDVSVLWLKKGVERDGGRAVARKNATAIGLGEIFYGPTLALNYNVGGLGPGQDPRTPGHHRDAEPGRDLLGQHDDDWRSRRVRA